MKKIIKDNKFVELKYRVIDQKTGDILVAVEFPIGYVHGINDVLSPQVTQELTNKSIGDIIELPIDCNQLYGPRDESLVWTDKLENVPKNYQKVGTKITMENEKGVSKDFLVTRVDDKTITIDGNNPLCGRKVIFKLEVLTIRDATAKEIEAGGVIDDTPDINEILQ